MRRPPGIVLFLCEQGASITSESVQFLFLTCEKMKMSAEVKYLSLEIFDR